MDYLTEPTKESESSSCELGGQKIKYFNSNYSEESKSSCQQLLDNSIFSNPAKPFTFDLLKSQKPKDEPKTKPNHMGTLTEGIISGFSPNIPTKAFNLENPADGTSFKEKTLHDMGFNSNKIESWDEIKQPGKECLIKLLKNMIENYIKTNVIIRINDRSFNCHMMVLQCYSGFFMNLDNEQIIVLPSNKVSPEAFIMIYDWMLSPEPKVQREGILQLFIAAQFLKIKTLVDQIWVCLDDHERFCEDAAFLLYLEARSFKLDLIMNLMLTRICKFFLVLVASKEFVEMDESEIISLLKSNSIGVNSEAEVLMTAVRWLNHDWSNRKCHVLDVLNCVRFGLMPPWFLVGLKKNQHCIEIQRVLDNKEAMLMIDDGLSYVLTKGYYSKNTDNYFHCLEKFRLNEPQQRQWICDENCSYHQKCECPNASYITYEKFLQYLDYIRKSAPNHWNSLQIRLDEEPVYIENRINYHDKNFD